MKTAILYQWHNEQSLVEDGPSENHNIRPVQGMIPSFMYPEKTSSNSKHSPEVRTHAIAVPPLAEYAFSMCSWVRYLWLIVSWPTLVVCGNS